MKLSRVANQEFRNCLMRLSKKPIPLKTAFKLKTIIKMVNEEHQKYEECRKEALNRLSEKDENGNIRLDESGRAKLSEENSKLFAKEFKDLLETQLEIPKIKASELGEDLKISTEELLLLEDLILEE